LQSRLCIDVRTHSSVHRPLRTDTAPLEDLFPLLGGLVEAHWQVGALGGHHGGTDRLAVGPTDWLVVGFAGMRPGAAAALVDSWQPGPAVPGEIPPELAGFVPAGVAWVRSDGLDKDLVRGA